MLKSRKIFTVIRSYQGENSVLPGKLYSTYNLLLPMLYTRRSEDTVSLSEYTFSPTGPTLLFRADTDAVAIPETLAVPYRSVNPDVSHKCGHDGHTSILLAFAELLHQHPLQQGKIILLFQPAEENGKGAQAVLQDFYFRHLKIDRAFALHNLPGFPYNRIICRPGSFTCSVISCTIRIQGKTLHAAEPVKTLSPTPVLLEILKVCQSWNQEDLSFPDHFELPLSNFISEKKLMVSPQAKDSSA